MEPTLVNVVDLSPETIQAITDSIFSTESMNILFPILLTHLKNDLYFYTSMIAGALTSIGLILGWKK